MSYGLTHDGDDDDDDDDDDALKRVFPVITNNDVCSLYAVGWFWRVVEFH